MGKDWFAVDQIDETTYVISEYKHWEQAHSYLLLGTEYAGLIDTGLGIGNIKQVVDNLTNLPVKVINTHAHWDHIGGNSSFADIYIHQEDADWLKNGFPISSAAVRKKLSKGVDKDDWPEGFNLDDYSIYQGQPIEIKDNDHIDLGARLLKFIHTPGHSPGHSCIYEPERGYLYTGDLIYQGTLYAFYPSTNPQQFLQSVVKISKVEGLKRIFPGHNRLDLAVEFLEEIKAGFKELKEQGLLFQGSGVYEFENFQVKL